MTKSFPVRELIVASRMAAARLSSTGTEVKMTRSAAALGPLKQCCSAQVSWSYQLLMLNRSRTQMRKSSPAKSKGMAISVMLIRRKSMPMLTRTESIPLFTSIFRTSSVVVRICHSESIMSEKLDDSTSNRTPAPTSPTTAPSVMASMEKSLSASVSRSMLKAGVTKLPPSVASRRAVRVPKVKLRSAMGSRRRRPA